MKKGLKNNVKILILKFAFKRIEHKWYVMDAENSWSFSERISYAITERSAGGGILNEVLVQSVEVNFVDLTQFVAQLFFSECRKEVQLWFGQSEKSADVIAVIQGGFRFVSMPLVSFYATNSITLLQISKKATTGVHSLKTERKWTVAWLIILREDRWGWKHYMWESCFKYSSEKISVCHHLVRAEELHGTLFSNLWGVLPC